MMFNYVEMLGSPHAHLRQPALNMARRFSETVVRNGVPRWVDSSRVPDPDVLDLWRHLGKTFDYEASLRAGGMDECDIQARLRRVGKTTLKTRLA